MTVSPTESSEIQFLAVSPRAQKYIDTALAVSELRELAAANPQDEDQYAPGISRGEVIMCITEPEAVKDFVAIIEVQEPQERAQRRAIIESIRDDPDFGTVITEDDIQSQLDALPAFPDYSPKVRQFVSGYFDAIGQWLVAVNSETSPQPSGSEAQPGESTGDGDQEDPEAKTEKPPLTITIYKDQVIQLGEDGQMVSLLRSMDTPGTTQEELYIADARLAALKLVAGHESEEDSKGLTSNDVWRTYAGDTKLNSMQHLIVSEFLEALQVGGDPVLEIYKPTEAAKRRYYRNGGFDVTFVETDQDSGLEQNDIFRLPNGEIIFGKRARVANMLICANEQQPVSLQDLIDSDVYSEEEKAEMGDKISLSGMVSFLRQRLGLENLLVTDDGQKHGYSIKSTKQADRTMVYWMEYRGEDDSAAGGPEVGETEYERDRSIADCRRVADWLIENEEILVRLGYQPFDKSAQSALQVADTLEPNVSISNPLQLRLIFDAVQIVASIDSSVEELIDKVPEDDPRWPIIDYLLGTDASSEGRITVNRLVEDFPEIDLRVNAEIVKMHDALSKWSTYTEREKESIAEDSYNLFDRIGNGLQKRQDVKTASPKTILPEINKILTDNNLLSLSRLTEDAFIRAHNQWIGRTGKGASTRDQRRAWGKLVRAELNKAAKPLRAS